MAGGHWTEDLFVRHADAFLAIHESAWAKGEEQSKDLRAVLERFGVPSAGHVLDAPCGIGRHATRLAGMGYRVVGVDISPAYIDRANALARGMGVADRVRYLVGDLRRLSETVPRDAGPFDASLNLWTSLGYYGEETDVRILQEYAKLTRPGGVFVLFIVNRDHVVQHFDPKSYEEFAEYVVIQNDRLDLAASWMRNEWRFFRRRAEDLEHVVTVPVEHRVYSLHELAGLLERGGWRVEAAFDGFKMGPPSIDAPTLLLVGRR